MDLRTDLIVDLGMHLGEDTDFYLKKGFRVVGVEANPTLIEHCKNRFKEAIEDGRVTILSGAIADEALGENVTFFVNQRRSVWGTIHPSWAVRNEKLGSSSSAITVPRLNLEDVFANGLPYYLKIDIEGAEKLVLDFLIKTDGRPKYISLESEKVNFGNLLLEMKLLTELGYRRFKVVQQWTIPFSKLSARSLDGSIFQHQFEPHSSGGFGNEAIGTWVGYEEAVKLYESIFVNYQLFGDNSILRRINPWEYAPRDPGWYDTHATI